MPFQACRHVCRSRSAQGILADQCLHRMHSPAAIQPSNLQRQYSHAYADTGLHIVHLHMMQQGHEQQAPSAEVKTLTGRTVTPALTVSRLQKATSSSWLPSGSNGLQPHPKLSEKHGLTT